MNFWVSYMAYWLCVTNEENWEVIKDKLVWGVPSRRRKLIEQVKPGDILIIYVKPKRIGGIFKVTSELYEDHVPIFSWAEYGRVEVFPLRVKLEPTIIPNRVMDIGHIIRNLSFAKGKTRWTALLRRGMVRLTEEDYDLIVRCLRKS